DCLRPSRCFQPISRTRPGGCLGLFTWLELVQVCVFVINVAFRLPHAILGAPQRGPYLRLRMLDVLRIHIPLNEQLEKLCREVDSDLAIRNARLKQRPDFEKRICSRSSAHACTRRQRTLRRRGRRLLRCPRCPKCLAIETRGIETTDALLARRQHVTGALDSLLASLRLLCGLDPMNPVNSRDRSRRFPDAFRLRRGSKSLLEIRRQLRLGLSRHGRHLHNNGIAERHASLVAQCLIDFQSMTQLAVWLERCLKGMAVDRAFYARPTAPRQHLAHRFRQDQECPWLALSGIG